MHETRPQSLSRAKRFWSQRMLIIFVLEIGRGVWGSDHLYESYQARRAMIIRAGFAPHLGPHREMCSFALLFG